MSHRYERTDRKTDIKCLFFFSTNYNSMYSQQFKITWDLKRCIYLFDIVNFDLPLFIYKIT